MILSDLSDETILQRQQESHLMLDTVKIYTRPLVAIKSVAHQDNLTSSENKILVNVLDKDVRLLNLI